MKRQLQLWRPFVWKVIITVLALVGFFTLAGPLACTAMRPLMFEETRYPRLISPLKSLAAYREVTRGGLGTVWTTRIWLTDLPERKKSIIYETRDSDNVPLLHWLDNETLIMQLPCDRIDHLSNPADWDEGANARDRVAIRFVYDPGCRVPPIMHKK